MIGSEASHDISTPRSFCTAGDNLTAPLVLTREDLAAFDPLTRLAAKMMISNGTAVLEGVPE